jgi:PAS domain S-box-containing protein
VEVRTPFSVRDAALVDALDDGVVVTDAARRVTDVSDRFCALVGYTRDELVGVCPPYPWWPGGEEPFADAAQKDVLVQRKDGSCLPVLVHETVRHGADADAAHIATFRDITERVIRERAVGEAERQFRLVFDDAPIGMALTGRTGRFVRVNRAFADMLGYAPEELVGMAVGGFTMPDDREQDVAQRARMLAGELDVDRRRKRYLGASGRIVYVDLTERLVRDESGEAVCMIAHV